MEAANRSEAERCLTLAREARARGEAEKARKLAQKSLRLSSTQRARGEAINCVNVLHIAIIVQLASFEVCSRNCACMYMYVNSVDMGHVSHLKSQ